VGSLVYEPGSGKLFAGAHGDGGLWVSDDGAGASWRRLAAGLERQHVYALAARDGGGGGGGGAVTLFLGASPAALYRSDDLGESWVEVSAILDVADTDKWTFPPPPHIPHVKQIVFHPSEAATLFVLVEQGALLKSGDDGASWTELAAYADADDYVYRDVHRLVIRPDAPEVLYLATGVGIYRSGDGGVTWRQLMRRGERIGYPDFVFLDPADGHTLYMGGARTNPRTWYESRNADSCVMRSTDEGASWSELDNGMPHPVAGAIEAMCQHVWDGGMMLAAATATGEVFISEDRGASWDQLAEPLAPVAKDHHYIPFLADAPRKAAMARRNA
jgi:photosystem II stability/assembly factor-like uncharacterized protein